MKQSDFLLRLCATAHNHSNHPRRRSVERGEKNHGLIHFRNIGCGSSRKHAPRSLEDFDFRVVITSAFAEIFYNSCFKIGILPVTLAEEKIAELVEKKEIENYQLKIVLENFRIIDSQDFELSFAVDEFRRYCSMNMLDDIGSTL